MEVCKGKAHAQESWYGRIPTISPHGGVNGGGTREVALTLAEYLK